MCFIIVCVCLLIGVIVEVFSNFVGLFSDGTSFVVVNFGIVLFLRGPRANGNVTVNVKAFLSFLPSCFWLLSPSRFWNGVR